MKKLGLLLLLGGRLMAQTPATDFRNFNWGMPLETVQANENAPLVHQEKNAQLVYRDNLGGYNCDVSYGFNDQDKLVSGCYSFTQHYSDPQLLLADYANFKGLLLEKYGNQTGEIITRINDVPVTQTQAMLQAIHQGNVLMVTNWHTPRSFITLVLSSTNKVPNLSIQYTIASADQLTDRALLQTALSKL